MAYPSLRSRIGTCLYGGIGTFALLRVPDGWSPVFLVGCARSGTTITIDLMRTHRQIQVLDEPRHIWRAVSPITDIWAPGVVERGGRIEMDETLVTSDLAARCRRMFYGRHLLSQRKILIEKLPINSFRIRFLQSIFGNSSFIHLIRHGLEVANSIRRTGPKWYGRNDGWRWLSLCEIAQKAGMAKSFLSGCHSAVEKGLVEWTLCVEACRTARKDKVSAGYLELRYEDLLSDPASMFQDIAGFLDVTPDDRLLAAARSQLDRRNPSAAELTWPKNIHEKTVQLLRDLDYSSP